MASNGTAATHAVPAKWDATKIQSQKGKTAIVTGANSGIGYTTALELARHGAHVVLACRSEAKGKDAVNKIEEELKLSPEAGRVEFQKLDVSSLASVKAFADAFKTSHDRLDLLINNAGIMAVPHALTVDGYESQFATNHLGHFALTAQLFDLLKKSEPSRIVNLSSLAHRQAKMDLNEVMTSKDNYAPMPVYQNSKLYNLLFTMELNRRLHAKGISGVTTVAAHPGVTDTNLFEPLKQNAGWFVRKALGLVELLPIAQKVEMGALPSLYAATATGEVGGLYIGPNRMSGFCGYPTVEEPVNVSKSEEHAAKLWTESERLAKLQFEL